MNPVPEEPTGARLPLSPDAATLARNRPGGSAVLPTIPGYDLIRILGQGGMGIVYLARDRQLDRLVAVKMIRDAATAEPEDLLRFHTEARAIAALRHPGIVQLYDSGETQGQPYFTLEYLAGGSLAARIVNTALPAAEAAGIVHALAEAMSAAHDRGILHRDLKPENVLLAEDGSPRITDFGLARLRASAGATRTRDVMGTPDFMAPEQARGDTAGIGPAADVWALGVILYRLVTGRLPFQADTGVETLRLVLDSDAVPVRRLIPACPHDLETIIHRALQKDAGRRYATAGQLADDLGRFRAGKPITARPIGHLERAWMWVRRNPVVALLLVTTVVTLLAATVVSSVLAYQASEAARVAEDRRLDAVRASEREAQAARDEQAARRELELELIQSRSSQFSAHLARVGPLVESQAGGVRNELLDENLFPSALRDPAWGLLLAQTRRGQWAIPGGVRPSSGAEAGVFAFDPTGRILARATPGALLFLDAYTGRPFSGAQPMKGQPVALAYTSTGRYLLGLDNSTLYQWELPGGRQIGKWSPGGLGFQYLVVAPDDDEVLIAGPTAPLWSVRLSGGPARRLADRAQGLALSPDGATLAYGDEGIHLVDRAGGRETLLTENLPFSYASSCLAFGAGGRLLASGHAVGSLTLWDLARQRALFTLSARGVRVGISNVAFHPTRPILAVVHETDLILHDLLDGRDILTLPITAVGPNRCGPLAFRPDCEQLLYLGPGAQPLLVDTLARPYALEVRTMNPGRQVYQAEGRSLIHFESGGRIEVRSSITGEQLTTWSSVPPDNLPPTVSTANDRLALVTRSGSVEMRSLATGKIQHTFRLPDPIQIAELSPDGKHLVVALERGKQIWVAVHHAHDGKHLWEEPIAAIGTLLLACSPTHPYLAIGDNSRQEILFRTVNEGRTPHPPISVGMLSQIQFLAGGTLLGLVDQRRLVQWDPTTGQEVRRIGEGTLALEAFAVSPDGRTAVTSGRDRQLRFWDVPSGRLRHACGLPGEVGNVPGLASILGLQFNASGDQLALLTAAPVGSVLRVFETPWRTPAGGGGETSAGDPAMALRRRVVEPVLRTPWDPLAHQRLALILAEQGDARRAALHAAVSVWQRFGVR